VGEVAIAIDYAIKQCGGQIPYPKKAPAAHEIGINRETILTHEQRKIDPRVERQMQMEGKTGCILGMGIIFCTGIGIFWNFINKTDFGPALFGLVMAIGSGLAFILIYNKLFKK